MLDFRPNEDNTKSMPETGNELPPTLQAPESERRFPEPKIIYDPKIEEELGFQVLANPQKIGEFLSSHGASREDIESLTIVFADKLGRSFNPLRFGERPAGHYIPNEKKVEVALDEPISEYLHATYIIQRALSREPKPMGPSLEERLEIINTKLEEILWKLEEHAEVPHKYPKPGSTENAVKTRPKRHRPNITPYEEETINKRFVSRKRLLSYLKNEDIPRERKLKTIQDLSEIAVRRYLNTVLLHEMVHFLQFNSEKNTNILEQEDEHLDKYLIRIATAVGLSVYFIQEQAIQDPTLKAIIVTGLTYYALSKGLDLYYKSPLEQDAEGYEKNRNNYPNFLIVTATDQSTNTSNVTNSRS